MSDGSIATLFTGVVTISALHALIPSHWFAFAVVARARRWSTAQAMLVTLLAGAGHILLTVVLGVIVAGAGKALRHAIPEQAEHAATAILLILLGIYFAFPGILGRGHAHSHEECIHNADYHDDAHGDRHAPQTRLRKMGATPSIMGALVLGMTLSPCLDLLSVFAAAASLSWAMIGVAALVMAATTLSVMTALVGLTLAGLRRVRWDWLERHEGRVVGVTLVLLGLFLLVR